MYENLQTDDTTQELIDLRARVSQLENLEPLYEKATEDLSRIKNQLALLIDHTPGTIFAVGRQGDLIPTDNGTGGRPPLGESNSFVDLIPPRNREYALRCIRERYNR